MQTIRLGEVNNNHWESRDAETDRHWFDFTYLRSAEEQGISEIRCGLYPQHSVLTVEVLFGIEDRKKEMMRAEGQAKRATRKFQLLWLFITVGGTALGTYLDGLRGFEIAVGLLTLWQVLSVLGLVPTAEMMEKKYLSKLSPKTDDNTEESR